MKKGFKYLAMLGFASSCLISAAYANDGDDEVKFSIKPDFGNIVCEGKERHEHFLLTNKSDDVARINHIHIKINKGDSYPQNDDVVKVDTHHDDTYEGHFRCQRGTRLYQRESCVITTKVNPKTIKCDDSQLILGGEIERSLVVQLMSNNQRDVDAPIDFDVDTLGVAGEFALLGASITNYDAGAANVSQNIAYTSPKGHITDNITLNDDAQAYGPFNSITRYAVSDLKTSYQGLKHLPCTQIDHDLGNYDTIPSGTYCFEGSAPVVVKHQVKFSGNKPHIFIVKFHGTDPDDLTFDVQEGAKFLLENGASASRIYWVIDGSVRMHPKSQFAGTIMATGSFASEGEGSGALIDGRILLLKDGHEALEVNNPRVGELALHGNLIQNTRN